MSSIYGQEDLPGNPAFELAETPADYLGQPGEKEGDEPTPEEETEEGNVMRTLNDPASEEIIEKLRPPRPSGD